MKSRPPLAPFRGSGRSCRGCLEALSGPAHGLRWAPRPCSSAALQLRADVVASRALNPSVRSPCLSLARMFAANRKVTMKSFSELGLAEPLLRAVREQGYQIPTPIQAEAIPHVPGRPRRARLRPDRHRQDRRVRAAASCSAWPPGRRRGPADAAARARPLADARAGRPDRRQTSRAYGRHLPLAGAVIFGGVSQVPQVAALRRGVDVLVATPGPPARSASGSATSRSTAVRCSSSTRPTACSTWAFCPTCAASSPRCRPAARRCCSRRRCRRRSPGWPASCWSIRRAWRSRRPRRRPRRCDQAVLMVDQGGQAGAARSPARRSGDGRASSSSRAPSTAPTGCARSSQRQGIAAAAIHGNKSQNARERALADFKARRDARAGRHRHRGARHRHRRRHPRHQLRRARTSRRPTCTASAAPAAPAPLGDALSLCAPEERGFLRAIERMVKRPIEVLRDHPFHTDAAPVQAQPARPAAPPCDAAASSPALQRPRRRCARGRLAPPLVR